MGIAHDDTPPAWNGWVADYAIGRRAAKGDSPPVESAAGRRDPLFDGAKQIASLAIAHFDPDHVAELEEWSPRRAFANRLEHSELGEAGGAPALIVVGHRPRTDDRACHQGPGLGRVGDQLREGKLHVLAGFRVTERSGR